MTQSVRDADVRLTAQDGFRLGAFKASPEGDSKGGVVIIQEIFGVTDQLKSVARRYAQQGYDSIVPALFDRSGPGTVIPFTEGARGRDIAMGLDPAKVALDVKAAMGEVDSGRGVSILGFCWGGGQALRLASMLEPASVISFYGTRLTSFLDKTPSCPLLFHFGESDDHSPPEVIAAVREKLPGAETHIYKAGHAFANDVRPDMYVPAAAKLAHERTFEFLGLVHKGADG